MSNAVLALPIYLLHVIVIVTVPKTLGYSSALS